MNSMESMHSGTATAPAKAILSAGGIATQLPGGPSGAVDSVPKPSGYGLPCAKCRTYYSAALVSCPVCQSAERVSPNLPAANISVTENLEAAPTLEVLEQERERFLQEFKAQIGAGDLQINATSSFSCIKEENHEGSFEPAAVCQGCYEHLQERADQYEAALHIDVRDAAQIIYDAVWSDPSDPTKTYQNAAQALLNELRQRAGIPSVLGPMQPLQH